MGEEIFLLNKGLEKLSGSALCFPEERRLRGGSRKQEAGTKATRLRSPFPTKCRAVIRGHWMLLWAQLTALGGLGSA